MMNFEIISMRFSPVPAKRSGHLPFLLPCPRSFLFLFVRGWWSAFYLFTTRNFFVRLRRERRTMMMEKECPENCVGNHIISLPTPPPCTLQVGAVTERRQIVRQMDSCFHSFRPFAREHMSLGIGLCNLSLPLEIFLVSPPFAILETRHQSVEMVFLYPIYSSTMIYLHRRIRISASHSPSLGLHKWMCSRRA